MLGWSIRERVFSAGKLEHLLIEQEKKAALYWFLTLVHQLSSILSNLWTIIYYLLTFILTFINAVNLVYHIKTIILIRHQIESRISRRLARATAGAGFLLRTSNLKLYTSSSIRTPYPPSHTTSSFYTSFVSQQSKSSSTLNPPHS